MNKPAAKEPSMDEILSSIRQIIADDDAPEAASEAKAPAESADAGLDDLPSFDAFLAEEDPEPEPAPKPEPEPEVAAAPEPPFMADLEEEEAEDPLALSLDQVVDEPETEPESDPEPDESEFSLPDDVAFVNEDVSDPVPPMPAEERKQESNFGTMPDPALSEDLAEHLLDSTTQAAASQAFSRLGGMSFGGAHTVEGVVREMLKPMLKAWLDENLPSMVERLVEREIERVSRGGR